MEKDLKFHHFHPAHRQISLISKALRYPELSKMPATLYSITVDTEEEWNWSSGYRTNSCDVSNIRSLGNRSILYPAKDPEVNQWLNDQLGRTEFMPFAPAVLAEAAPSLFIGMDSGNTKTSEFMTITFDCTDEMKQHSPAAVHIDGTARPQLVTPASNPSFHKVLSHYQELSGIPVLINTSFNMHEEPIVGSPADAVRAFLLGNIDYLAAGRFLAPHPSRKEKANRMMRDHSEAIA